MKKLTDRERVAALKKEQKALGKSDHVVAFALDIDDHWDRYQFLKDWQEGAYWGDFIRYVEKKDSIKLPISRKLERRRNKRP